ncbi:MULTISPECIES: porin [unclassified Variovorax]|uniref:porin n=1 Tax=unclassified Variovorax TaxID=663243 RepID=UPI001BD5BDB0|nr:MULTISPECIES: porin [unclassified Variovorax]
MKKSLVGLAALTVLGTACAQSSVTLFGVLDESVSGYQNVSETPLGITAKTSRQVLASNGYNQSRLGFRGTEDLGGGLAATFWLESAIFPDDGTIGGNVANSAPVVPGYFNRRSTVSLSGGFGEVRLGRDYTPSFWNDLIFDPFSANGVGTNIIATANGFSSSGASVSGFQANSTYIRASNSVGYILPPNLGGFYGQVMYAFNEQIKYDPGITTPRVLNNSRAGGYWGGRFGYANNALDVAAAYGESTIADSYFAGLTTRLDTFNLGGSYDFGLLKLFGEFSKARLKTDNDGIVPVGTINASPRATGYLLGATVPIGPGLIRAAYSQVKIDPNRVIQQLTGEPTASKWAVGYVYNLSKRTALYATYAQLSNKNGYDLAVGSVPFVSGGTLQAKSSRGYDLGLRHAF